jgi:DNA-binding FadR family transcriptional regulator
MAARRIALSGNGRMAAGAKEPDGRAAHTQLQAYIAQREHGIGERLPPERELCDILGLSRSELRKALAIAEREGQIWRHVGKGTFFGPRPESAIADVTGIARLANPAQVMRARLLLEPAMCREAAMNANLDDIAELKLCALKGRQAQSWRHYETWDNRFHRSIAEATHNTVLLSLFDLLNAVRRAVSWGRLRDNPAGPPSHHHSFAEHDAIVAAVEERAAHEAGHRMHEHLQMVQRMFTEELAAPDGDGSAEPAPSRSPFRARRGTRRSRPRKAAQLRT